MLKKPDFSGLVLALFFAPVALVYGLWSFLPRCSAAPSGANVVLAVFMAGLGQPSGGGRRLSEPLRAYGFIESRLAYAFLRSPTGWQTRP
jgi:hypothetical protein